jgi:hypothetical protein
MAALSVLLLTITESWEVANFLEPCVVIISILGIFEH